MIRASLLALAVAVSTTCAAKADLATAVQLERITTGWVDTGVTDGKHKIVPAGTFVLKNVSDRTLGPIQVNAVFRQVDDPKEWSSAYVPNAAGELPPGSSSSLITIKGDKGYTSEDPPEVMLRNPQFVDARLEVFVRSGSSAWTKVGNYTVDRRLTAGPNAN